MTRILFVCMGNICRSPSAEGVARHLIEHHGLHDLVSVDSAGTHAYHTGEAPDRRAQAAAKRRGMDLAKLRARPVEEEDFVQFDLLLAMDRDNLRHLTRDCPPEHAGKLALLMRYARRFDAEEVPDPYFGGDAGFERVLDMLEDSVAGLLREVTGRPLE